MSYQDFQAFQAAQAAAFIAEHGAEIEPVISDTQHGDHIAGGSDLLEVQDNKADQLADLYSVDDDDWTPTNTDDHAIMTDGKAYQGVMLLAHWRKPEQCPLGEKGQNVWKFDLQGYEKHRLRCIKSRAKHGLEFMQNGRGDLYVSTRPTTRAKVVARYAEQHRVEWVVEPTGYERKANDVINLWKVGGIFGKCPKSERQTPSLSVSVPENAYTFTGPMKLASLPRVNLSPGPVAPTCYKLSDEDRYDIYTILNQTRPAKERLAKTTTAA